MDEPSRRSTSEPSVPQGLPRYTTQVNPRARRVRLRISAQDGLEVIVPRGFDERQIPHLLREHRRWIDRTMRRMAARHAPEATDRLPDRLVLQAVDEAWQVRYRPNGSPRIRIAEQDGWTLVLSGHTSDQAACRQALRRWLLRKAREHLVPWLTHLAQEQGFAFGKVTIRSQRTRWGSCSQRRERPGGSDRVPDSQCTLSLNAKLLFLPPRLVRYVLLHELCHTVAHDHSPAFWALLRRCEPQTPALRKELRDAWELVPG